MVAYHASKKPDADPCVGFSIMAVMMLPGLLALGNGCEPTTILNTGVTIVPIVGIPLTIFYGPPLLIAAVLGPLYKRAAQDHLREVCNIFVPYPFIGAVRSAQSNAVTSSTRSGMASRSARAGWSSTLSPLPPWLLH